MRNQTTDYLPAGRQDSLQSTFAQQRQALLTEKQKTVVGSRWTVDHSGQAMVTLLIFIATILIITTAAIAVSAINTQSTSQYSQGQKAYDLAEAGAEDAIMRLVRNNSFDSPSPGYTLTVGTNNAQIIVTPPGLTSPKTIVSRGTVNNQFKRKIQVIGNFNSTGVFSIVSWNEIDD